MMAAPYADSVAVCAVSERLIVLMRSMQGLLCAAVLAHGLLDLRFVVAVDDFPQIVQQLNDGDGLRGSPVFLDDQRDARLQA